MYKIFFLGYIYFYAVPVVAEANNRISVYVSLQGSDDWNGLSSTPKKKCLALLERWNVREI